MRRLINFIYTIFLGLQIKTHAQHVGDLERELEQLHLSAQRIDADIEIFTHRLLAAHSKNDEFTRRKHEYVDTLRHDRRISIHR